MALLGIGECAKRTGLTYIRMWQVAQSKGMPITKIGRKVFIDEQDLENWIEKRPKKLQVVEAIKEIQEAKD